MDHILDAPTSFMGEPMTILLLSPLGDHEISLFSLCLTYMLANTIQFTDSEVLGSL